MSNKTKHILIVEDEKPLSHALELKLHNEGHTTRVVTNGQDALSAIKEDDFDVMLLDMMMPVMDGFQVLEKLQDVEKKPVIFVLSNLSLHDDKDRVLGMGARDFFVKSEISLADVVHEINQT